MGTAVGAVVKHPLLISLRLYVLSFRPHPIHRLSLDHYGIHLPHTTCQLISILEYMLAMANTIKTTLAGNTKSDGYGRY